MKMLAAIVALVAVLLISISPTFAARGEGRVSDENPYAFLSAAK